MVSCWKKLVVLLWKCYVLRKRNWLLTIFELISPISVVWLLWFTNLKFSGATNEILGLNQYNEYASSFNEIYKSPVTMKESTYIAYAPNTAFTNQLMDSYKASVLITDPNQKLSVDVKRDEMELEAALKEKLLPNSGYSCVLGVLFTNPTMKFKYKLLGNVDEVLEKKVKPSSSRSMLLKLQAYLDAQYLKSVGVNYKDSTVLIGEFLQSNNGSYDDDKSFERKAYIVTLHIYLTLAYTFLVAAVVRDTIQEKSSGIKELMRTMGLSSWMIWIHWFIYSLIVQIPVSVVIVLLLTVISPHVFEINPAIAWILFLLVTIDYIVIFFCVTCLFDKATKATVLCVVFWIIVNFASLAIIFPEEYSLSVQILISLIPLINLVWTIQSLSSFNTMNVDWDLSYLFTKGYNCSQISAGVGIIILICEIVLLTFLLAYLDAVKPGHYGVAKPVTFIFGCCIKLWHRKSLTGSEVFSLPSEFELPQPGTKVGIEVRGLHKEFGILNKSVAVDCVNLDIYEGEVTVLLGHNGAGKTTTMSMITGMFSPTSGTVSVDGMNIYDNLYSFRQNLGLCTQHNLYFPKLTVLEHLLFFGMLKGRSYAQAKGEGKYLLYLLNLLDKKDLRGSKLSGGMLRRLCLAVALTGGPKVLILDEPTSGLDPENRRHIWDIILSLRGERTILITTHYMEEADVLGDRIAIMDHGKVVCCGTTLFLKKLYGTGYNVHVTKSPKASVMDITQCIQRFIPKFVTKVVSPAQVDYSIKDEFVERFPDLFSTLESSMNSLNMSALSVSCTTMEDVFLRVAELSEEQDKDRDEQPTKTELKGEPYNLVEGATLIMQRVEALIMKRVVYISKHWISTIVKLLIAWAFILAATLLADYYKVEGKNDKRSVYERKVDSTLYSDLIYPIVYDELNTKTAIIAQNIIRNSKGQVVMMKFNNTSDGVNFGETNHHVNELLTNMAHSANESNNVALASTFIENGLLIQYQTFLNPFASSNAANLMANILLKRVHPDRSIEVVSHPLSSKSKACVWESTLQAIMTVFFLVALIPCSLTLVISDFIPLIVEERASGFMYQQIIAGVYPSIFRLVSVLCDFFIYIVFITVSVVIILIFGNDVIPFSSENMRMLLLVLILYGVSSIIFLNIYTYISNSLATATGLYIVLNLAFVLVCPISLLILSLYELYIQVLITAILSFHPSAAGFFAIFCIAKGIAMENVGPCSVSYLEFPSSSNRHSILMYVMFLVLDIIVYSIALWFIDCKIWERMTYTYSEILDNQGGDNDVKLETHRVRMYKEAKVDTIPLRAEGLVKNYHSFRAANQVSFVVSWGECFGLLGVNGAGKTTTFKMLTGEITPSSGDAFSTKFSVVSNTQQYLSNIGYCPQFDALLDDLTGNNTLTIIAKLRGVPRNEVRRQVDYWMATLGIIEHADKRTKTYSGGTKRKLGTAMAFIGEPVVALLDEPTTGVDPAARRKVWSAVKDRQSLGYSAVLSSHSMEECEALCSRLTIMRRGELCCIGSVQELKTKFGQGFMVMLKMNFTEEFQAQLTSLKNEFLKSFPKSVVQDENVNMITYRVLNVKTSLSTLFSEAIRLKKKYTIVEDFMVCNATLEQLFLTIARGQDIRKGRSSSDPLQVPK